MPFLSTFVECPVRDSFRVRQVSGMFDLPCQATLRQTFTAEFPGLDEAWSIGAVVGPSGSGKTTLARHAFGDAVWRPGPWPEDRAVIDGFGDLPIRTITQTLTAVGFSSPPSWLKPYHVLSNGEKFRCEMAKALLQSGSPRGSLAPRVDDAVCGAHPPRSSLVVFDEFTSAVDRTAARIGSAAVAKAIRSGRINARFVAVTCHYDVLEWLEVDWRVDLADGQLRRRRLRRPQLRLAVERCDPGLWRTFARHHYLNQALPAASACYVAGIAGTNDAGPTTKDEEQTTEEQPRTRNEEVERRTDGAASAPSSYSLRPSSFSPHPLSGTPVAFCAVSSLFGGRGRRRISRIVVLPDFQGVGIGVRLLDTVAAHHAALGQTIRITTGHPAMLAYLQRSPHWRGKRVYRNRKPRRKTIGRQVNDAAGRCVATFEFLTR